MRIIVTGALGHIGSSLIRSLPHTFPGSTIVLIDNLLTMRYCSLFNLPGNGNFQFIEADVLTMNFEEFLSSEDVVIHLAAITDAASSFNNPTEVEKVNFQGTEIIAKACAKNGAKLIFLSTTSVYGTAENVVDENCGESELRPQSPYATSKYEAEKMLKILSENNSLKYVICRFGTIFGCSIGMRFHTAVNKFCWQAVMGQSITVWTTAYDQKRPYLDLKDAVKSLEHIIEKDLFSGEVFNVLTINATVREIVSSISKVISKVDIKFTDSKIMNQLSYEVLNNKFISTGFSFHGDLNQSISETLSTLQKANNL